MKEPNKALLKMMKIISVILALGAAITSLLWWQMPYMHHIYPEEYLNLGVHIAVFIFCAVVCICTFVMGRKQPKTCLIMGVVLLAASLSTNLVNSGFVPPIWLIELFSLLYCFVTFAYGRPVKEETLTTDQLSRAYRISRIITVVSAVVAAFSILFPKGHRAEGIDMATGGVIEYYTEYTPFDIILTFMIPISLIVFVLFLIRTILMSARIKRLSESEEQHEKES